LVNATGGLPADAARNERSSRSAGPSWSSPGTSDPEAHFHDLGAGFYDTRIGPERAKRNHVRQLEALGYKVILEPAA
jgi:hypothetical protein